MDPDRLHVLPLGHDSLLHLMIEDDNSTLASLLTEEAFQLPLTSLVRMINDGVEDATGLEEKFCMPTPAIRCRPS